MFIKILIKLVYALVACSFIGLIVGAMIEGMDFKDAFSLAFIVFYSVDAHHFYYDLKEILGDTKNDV